MIARLRGRIAGHQGTGLIVDVNGQAGYQASADLVIQLLVPLHVAALDIADFV